MNSCSLPTNGCHGRSSEKGAALLAVLWVVALLIGLVAGASLLLMQDLDLGATRRQVFRARMLAESGLALAVNPDIKPDDPLLRQQVSPDERVAVEMTGEDGLLNLNVLLQRVQQGDRETLRRVLRYWGLELQPADALIDCLVDWVDPDDFVNNRGAEKRAYGRNGMPFNRPFRSIEEVTLVRGMQQVEELYPAWRTWFSVYASGVLDINEARPEIISAVTGADLRLAQQMRARRLGPDGIANTEDDAPQLSLENAMIELGLGGARPEVLAQLIGLQSNTRRILVKVQVGSLERQLAAVVRGAPGAGSSAILWMGER
jgi:type II secretory pathway component PulK